MQHGYCYDLQNQKILTLSLLPLFKPWITPILTSRVYELFYNNSKTDRGDTGNDNATNYTFQINKVLIFNILPPFSLSGTLIDPQGALNLQCTLKNYVTTHCNNLKHKSVPERLVVTVCRPIQGRICMILTCFGAGQLQTARTWGFSA